MNSSVAVYITLPLSSSVHFSWAFGIGEEACVGFMKEMDDDPYRLTMGAK
jgi:hypothetical protein